MKGSLCPKYYISLTCRICEAINQTIKRCQHERSAGAIIAGINTTGFLSRVSKVAMPE